MKVLMFAGQGSQFRGMGKSLFPLYPAETSFASGLLGYDVADLCVNDRLGQLSKTEFTQPALYIVNALSYLERAKKEPKADCFIGHSLGEYNALFAAGAFDFETGLRLVQKRGALMSQASGGAMAAVVNKPVKELVEIMSGGTFPGIDIANFNTPTQTVISGPKADVGLAVEYLGSQNITAIPLAVSAAFHSRYMETAADAFAGFLKDFSFSELHSPVFSNATLETYGKGNIANLLSIQVKRPVLWLDTITMLLQKGASQFDEIGGMILSKMVAEIKNNFQPGLDPHVNRVTTSPQPITGANSSNDTGETKAVITLITNNLFEILPELEGQNLSPDESFVKMGANSVDRGELITLTLESLNLEIPRIEFVCAKTINELATLIVSKMNNLH